MNHITQSLATRQQGIVLVVALLILMVMTVIGTSMLSTATLEERMASNLQTYNATFQAANSCFKNTINTPPSSAIGYSTFLESAINNDGVEQTNECDDPAAPGTDLYGADFRTQAKLTADGSATFEVRGYDSRYFDSTYIPITVTASLPNTSTGVTLTISGGLIIPKTNALN